MSDDGIAYVVLVLFTWLYTMFIAWFVDILLVRGDKVIREINSQEFNKK